MLRFLAEHGNTTVYQWRTGVAPTSILRQNDISCENEPSNQDTEVSRLSIMNKLSKLVMCAEIKNLV